MEASAAPGVQTTRFATLGATLGPCALACALTGFAMRIVVAGRGWPVQEFFGQALELLGFLLALAGLAVSALGMGEPAGRRRAIAGLVTSGLALILPILLAILVLLAIVAAFSGT